MLGVTSNPHLSMLTRYSMLNLFAMADQGSTASGVASCSEDGVIHQEALDRLRALDPQGDTELVKRIVKIFENSTERMLLQLQEPSITSNHKELRLLVHTLKSSSATVGAMKLSQLCGDIEAQIRSERLNNLDENISAVCSEIVLVLKALKTIEF